jgi:hypothetical protein
MKKSWSKPKLIVLFRGKPEESVLTSCKDSSVDVTANAEKNSCQGLVSECGDCSGLGS